MTATTLLYAPSSAHWALLRDKRVSDRKAGPTPPLAIARPGAVTSTSLFVPNAATTTSVGQTSHLSSSEGQSCFLPINLLD